MEVTGPGSVNNINKLFPVKPVDSTQNHASSQPISERDVVEISPAGKMIDKQHPTNDLRAQRIERIKIAIQEGRYETQDKLEAALDKLLKDVLTQHGRKPE